MQKRLFSKSSILFIIPFLFINSFVNSMDIESAKPKKEYATKKSGLTEYYDSIVNPENNEIKTSKKEKTYVRIGNTLCDGEKSFLEKRKKIIHTKLEALLNRKIDPKNVPNIDVLTSGGGCRAELGTAGSFAGMGDLLDIVTYVSGVSGSTWYLSALYASGMSPKELADHTITSVSKDFFHIDKEEIEQLIKIVKHKKEHAQNITFADPYGWLLANRLPIEKEKRQTITMSQLAERIQNGDMPYPIFAATGADKLDNPDWYEFTPHEIGSMDTETYVPTYGFGYKYSHGKPKKHLFSEDQLNFLEAICGSAFAAPIKLLVKKLEKDHLFIKALNEILSANQISKHLKDDIEDNRPLDFYGKVRNPAYKIDGHPQTKEKHLKLVDAGLTINLPYPLVSGKRPERKADILIVLDYSAGTIGGELKKMEEYAQSNKLPFPFIYYGDIDKKIISVFKNEDDPSVPDVLYMPRISDRNLWEENKSKPEFMDLNLDNFDFEKETNHGFCETRHFNYTKEHAKKVVDQTTFNMIMSKSIILKTIEEWLDRREKK